MADNFDSADILSQVLRKAESTANQDSGQRVLNSIDESLKDIAQNIDRMSAANARNNNISNRTGSRRGGYSGGFTGSAFNQFQKEFGNELLKELVGVDFKKSMNAVRDQLLKDFGGEIGDLPSTIGKSLAKQAAQSFKSTSLGKDISGSLKNSVNSIFGKIKDAYFKGSGSAPGVADAATEAAAGLAEASEVSAEAAAGVAEMSATAASTDAALTGLAMAGGEVAAVAGPLGIALIALDFATQDIQADFKRLGEDINNVIASSKKAAKRNDESRRSNLQAAQQRLEADIKSMVEIPFNVLADAAQKWYDAWDTNLRTITATQGYSKSDLQSLLVAYTQRLSAEGLSSVISGADLTTNLSRVLESGLSGAVAEEFAYIATKLNAAIPTQDFFEYASTYSSIAANAIKNGMAQADAIALANSELEAFASDVLYASRELAGGFSTGLKDAQSLFTQSAQIAQASKTGNVAQIAGVMTAVSAIAGAIAPDLATAMTDIVYKAATGGNSAEIVALRSLAGINASNTAFLKQLATDPQQVFGTLFSNLADMQNMSNDAFMEVAEGLSSVFGVSMDAFARIDFQYLADAINAMSVDNTSLLENMDLLIAGQTTTSAEMMRYNEVNQRMAEEGLAYVLDSEQGRVMQQHMWDEQLARQLTEATYAVELEGSVAQAVITIQELLKDILKFLLPGIKALEAGINIGTTEAELLTQQAELAQILELSKVGNGNALAKRQLTRRNKDLGLTGSLIELLGGTYSASSAGVRGIRGLSRNIDNAFTDLTSGLSLATAVATATAQRMGLIDTAQASSNMLTSAAHVTSAYTWGMVGKSVANAISSTSFGKALTTSATNSTVEIAQLSATAAAEQQATQNLQSMIDGMETFVQENRTASYAEWASTAKQYGIADFKAALETAGLTDEQLSNQFTSLHTDLAALDEADRKKREETFWSDSVDKLIDSNNYLLDILSMTTKINDNVSKYLEEWEDYFISHTIYSGAFNSATVDKILQTERQNSETAIYALADALTENDVSLLVDPTLQTNALLAQILKVVNAMMNQQSGSAVGGVSLAETIAGLSLGIVNQ